MAVDRAVDVQGEDGWGLKGNRIRKSGLGAVRVTNARVQSWLVL